MINEKLIAQSFNSVIQPKYTNSIIVHKPDFAVNDSLRNSISVSRVKMPGDSNTTDTLSIINLLIKARLPLKSIYLTSGYGYRTHPVTGEKNSFHPGIDLSARHDSVYCVLHGMVAETGYNRYIGNYIRVIHGNYTSIYGHLSQIFVSPGDLVAPGTVLGITGRTGRVTGEHLHFSVKYKDKFLNPLGFLYAILNLSTQKLLYVLNN